MHTTTACPECGTTLSDGCCPNCAAFKTNPDQTEVPQQNAWPRPAFLLLGTIVASVLLILVVRFVNPTYSPFNRSDLRVQRLLAAREGTPLAPLGKLEGSGRIYLVQLGPHTAHYELDDFARWLREKYSLDVQVLPPMALDDSTWDSVRKQHVAELLNARLTNAHPHLAAEPQAYFIGFIDKSMFSVTSSDAHYFSWRFGERSAVISSYGMEDPWDSFLRRGRNANQALQAKLRRILLKDVAVLYWHLPPNNDPASVLAQPLDVDIPLEDIYASDLDPEHTKWGRFEGEPCVFFRYSTKEGIERLPGKLIRHCGNLPDGVKLDESLEVFEVDLRLGLLIDLHTDFYIPETPLWLQRATRDGWQGPMAFGISGTHNFDKYLQSADMRQITVIESDGARFELKRVPSWLPVLPWVKYVDAEGSGRMVEMRWRDNQRFEMKHYNGEVETFMPSETPNELSYQIGYKNQLGEKISFERDHKRRLLKLASGDQRWLELNYEAGDRISQIRDNRGRTVRYSYDDGGRLVSVTYPSGEIFYYEYDDTQHLLKFSAATSAKVEPTVILQNEYENGLITKQTLQGNKVFAYSYSFTTEGKIGAASVRTPEGHTFDVAVYDSTSRIIARD